LPILISGTRLHLGLILALLAVPLIWFLVQRTTIGFRIRTVGFSQGAARAAGISVAWTLVITMGISGALAGLAGADEILGVSHYMPSSFSVGYGFDSIAVALLARSNPWAILPSAFLFGAMRNVALEGIMLTSAFAGYAAAVATHNLWIGVLVAIIAGMLIAALHAVLSIQFLVDQIVSGTVINILAVGITGSFYRTYIQNSSLGGTGVLPALHLTFLPNAPFIGVITLAALALIPIVHFVLFNTVFGLRTRACGEHPLAAETAGINVYLVRYSNVILSGALAGLGGAYFTLQQIGNFLPTITGGRGLTALARRRCVRR